MAAAASIQKIHLRSLSNEVTSGSRGLYRFATKASGSNNSDSNSDPAENKTDWDSAWSSYSRRGQKKQRSLFDLNMEQHVTRDPIYSNFPMDEEIDQLRKAERMNLQVWTDPKFTYAGFSVIFCLFILMAFNQPQA